MARNWGTAQYLKKKRTTGSPLAMRLQVFIPNRRYWKQHWGKHK
jgi:hypothetical protein